MKLRQLTFIKHLSNPIGIEQDVEGLVGLKFIDRADEPKKLVVIEGAGHNDLNMFAAGSIARDFIESLTPSLP